MSGIYDAKETPGVDDNTPEDETESDKVEIEEKAQNTRLMK